MAQLQLKGVSKIFPRGVRAVDGLDLEVREGELLVLVGPSGCGKSTTLRLIAGLERPTAGEIRIAGQRMNDVPPAKRGIAMVFQHDALLPHLSVRKNLGFGLRLARDGWLQRLIGGGTKTKPKLANSDIDQRVADIAQLLSIEPLVDRRPSELSGGQRQRVALGRAMVRQPRVLLLDEPLAHLDAQVRSDLRAELRRMQLQQNTTMIYVTHDGHEAMTLGDRLAVMDRGRIWQSGVPLDLYDRPTNRLVASLIGNPPMNILEGKTSASGGILRFCGSGFAVDFPPPSASRLDAHQGKSVVLGVRPEHVRVLADKQSPAGHLAGVSLAMIDMVEALGDSTILRLRLELNGQHSNPIAAKIMGRTSVRPGDRVEVVIDPAKCHLFHATTGENLTNP